MDIIRIYWSRYVCGYLMINISIVVSHDLPPDSRENPVAPTEKSCRFCSDLRWPATPLAMEGLLIDCYPLVN